MTKTLQERIDAWKEHGKRDDEITYGMLGDGFRSIAGMPDDFYSAEDPADRSELWHKYQMENDVEYAKDWYRAQGRCWRCGREGCGCD